MKTRKSFFKKGELQKISSYQNSCKLWSLVAKVVNKNFEMLMMMMIINMLHFLLVSQHKLFNEHLVSASGNPALVMRRKKHTEKEVHAHLISVVSVRLREGYTIREISLTKGA